MWIVMLMAIGAGDLVMLADVTRPKPHRPVQVLPLNESEDGSAYIVWVDSQVRAHYHGEHTEWVVVLEGEGRLTLDGREFEIRPGQQIMIPRNAVHSVVVSGDRVMKVLSIQTPRFDPKDRIYVDD